MKYFGNASRFGPAVNLFEKLVMKDGEMASLLARAYIGMDEEVKAAQVLYRAIQEHPQSYPLLHVQCDFLRQKGKHEWAHKLAKQAVNCAPSEFVTWAKLTEVNIELKQYEEALLTLNSCPMFTYNERDLHRMPTPSRTHLPTKAFISDSGILQSLESSEQDNEAELALLRLPAPNLRGTFKRAYELLASLVGQIGWDELLKARSEVFVMEEEYRIQKQAQEEGSSGAHAQARRSKGEEELSVGQKNGDAEGGADDDASIRAMRAQPNGAEAEGNGDQSIIATPLSPSAEPPASPIPEIRISEHSDQAPEVPQSALDGPAPGVEKPATTHLPSTGEVGEDEKAKESAGGVIENGAVGTESAHAAAETMSPGFTNKRLCERWLDNLFMVLYEVCT